MKAATAPFLDELQSATARAEAAEAEFRRDFSVRLKAIERERQFAYRRLNLMRAISEVVAIADSEEIAVANALGYLRSRFGWTSDSEPRSAVLSRFAPVGKAVFLSSAPPEAEADEADVIGALQAFEAWYAETHGSAFWDLFEHYIPETPVVDF